HTRFSRDWSSDVCSSDLGDGLTGGVSGWAGTGLGESGFLNLSADYSYRGETDRSGPDIRPRYFRIGPDGSPLPPDSTAGEPDPRSEERRVGKDRRHPCSR